MSFYQRVVNVIGCGFAGIECALFLAGHGVKVHLFDDAKNYSCNCARCKAERESEKEELWTGLLKRELLYLGSPLIKEEERLIEGGYSGCIATKVLQYGKELVKNSKNIEYFEACISQLNPKEINVIATGSNTDERLFQFLLHKYGSMRCFNKQLVCPIVTGIDESYLKIKKGDSEHLYLPLSYSEYLKFVNTIIKVLNELGTDRHFCEHTIEDLAWKGKDALRNFALMPVYLEDVSERPYAVLTLKKSERGYILEGISSQLDAASQNQIIKSLKGFERAVLEKKAEVEDAVYLNAKYVINEYNQSSQDKNIFFAGSILGLSNYYDCIASGFMTAMNVYKYYNDMHMLCLPGSSFLGLLSHKIISTSLLKENANRENYDIIETRDDYAKPSFIEKLFNRSVESLTRFKEEYLHGKHV